MGYIKATAILPEELLEIIQDYVDGEYIYIPRKEENKKLWGQNTKIKKEYSLRNESIYREYLKGVSTKTLSEKYYLSEKSIQRIILKLKRETISHHTL